MFRRRLLIIAKLKESGGGNLVVDYSNSVLTLNDNGNGKKTYLDGDTLWLL